MLTRLALSLVGSMLGSLPLLSHMHPKSMLADPEQAIQISICFHTLLLFALLTSTKRHGRDFEVTVAVIWVVAFWVTTPNTPNTACQTLRMGLYSCPQLGQVCPGCQANLLK